VREGVDEVWVLTRIDGPASLASLASLASRVMRFRPDVAFVMNSVSRPSQPMRACALRA
jgi:hypothetical protein